MSYQWDFGDGSTGTGPTPTHTYVNNNDERPDASCDLDRVQCLRLHRHHHGAGHHVPEPHGAVHAERAGWVPSAHRRRGQPFPLGMSTAGPTVMGRAWTPTWRYTKAPGTISRTRPISHPVLAHGIDLERLHGHRHGPGHGLSTGHCRFVMRHGRLFAIRSGLSNVSTERTPASGIFGDGQASALASPDITCTSTRAERRSVHCPTRRVQRLAAVRTRHPGKPGPPAPIAQFTPDVLDGLCAAGRPVPGPDH